MTSGKTTDEIRTLVEAMSGIAAILRAAHPADRRSCTESLDFTSYTNQAPLNQSGGQPKWIMY
jgi:hypothetical protein